MPPLSILLSQQTTPVIPKDLILTHFPPLLLPPPPVHLYFLSTPPPPFFLSKLTPVPPQRSYPDSYPLLPFPQRQAFYPPIPPASSFPSLLASGMPRAKLSPCHGSSPGDFYSTIQHGAIKQLLFELSTLLASEGIGGTNKQKQRKRGVMPPLGGWGYGGMGKLAPVKICL